jgi:hypothetical protein
MFMTCNCGHSFTVDDGQSGQFVECPECGQPRLGGADAASSTGLDGLHDTSNGPSGGPISIDTEVPLPPLTWRRSNCRIAIDVENGTIKFENCFIPDTGFWTLRRRVVESHSCSLSDVARAFRYSTSSSNQDGWELGREQWRVTEIVTTTGKACFSVDPWKQHKRGDYEGDRDERLLEICDYLNSEGYVSLEGTPPSHSIILVVVFLVAFVALALYFMA